MPKDFASLLSDMLGCTLCRDLPLGPNPIFQLDRHAKILVVGQAPGRITHEKNRPFDDPSGDRLRTWMGIDRETFYNDHRLGIFPMALCFPGTGKGGDLAPPPICAETWRQPVMDALQDVELTLVLGAYAIGWHLPDQKGASVTAAVTASAAAQGHVIVLPHPSPRNNRWLKTNPWFEQDVVPRIQTDVRRILG